MNRLIKGDVLQSSVDATKYQVLSTEMVDGCLELYSCEERSRQFHPLADIHVKIATQELRLERPQQAIVSPVEQDDPAYQSRLHRALRCLRKVQETAQTLGISFDKAQQLARAESKDKDFPSRSVLYRFRDNHFQDRPLLKGNRNKGCRTPRYRPEVYELITQNAHNLYCQPASRWRMPALTQCINLQARECGYIGQDQHISQRHIRHAIKKHGFVDTDAHRLDPKLVAAARSIGAKRIQTSLPLERVELDSVHLPFYVKTGEDRTSNVWCTHAIDCHTGMVLGWKITIGTPTEDSGLDCIHSMLNSKKDAFKRLGLSFDHDVYGTPSLIIFDNGAEAKGQRMESLVRIGIDTEHCPGRHPHKKPFIERLNRSLKEALETLPGCSRMDGIDGKRDPIAHKDVLMSVGELECWLVRWYYEEWAHQVLERHLLSDAKVGATAFARWKYFTQTAGYVMPLPVPRDAWRKVTFVKSQRRLSRKTGVSYEGFSYKGANLTHLLQLFGEDTVTVFADPRDYRVLHVDDGTQLIELVEEYVESNSPAYTMTEYKERVQELREQAKSASKDSTFRKDLLARSAQDAGKKPARKSTLENRKTTEKNRTAQAIQRAIEKPVSPQLTGAVISAPVDFSLNLGELPTLDVLDRRTGESKA